MENNLFGTWLAEQQKSRQLSDTKLAAALGTTATSVSRWKLGVVTPRDDAMLDSIATFFGEDRSNVYAMAGRGRVGLDTKGLNPEFAEIAFALQMVYESIKQPSIKAYFFDVIKRKMNESTTEIESVTELVNSLPEE